MTTTIPSKYPNPLKPLALVISDGDDNPVHFSIDLGPDSARINVDRAALFDAVRSELGVLIIDKADLPEVTVEGNSTLVGVGHGPLRISASRTRSRVSEMRRISLAYLALAEYLEAHPPVDEQQVSNLTQIIDLLGADWASCNESELARRLIATGKVTVQP